MAALVAIAATANATLKRPCFIDRCSRIFDMSHSKRVFQHKWIMDLRDDSYSRSKTDVKGSATNQG